MAEIILDKINYTYSDGTAYEIQALKDVNLQIHQGEFIGIIGHTGSGKSTLTQLLNGLLRASSGSIYVDGQDIYAMNAEQLAQVRRQKIGFIFQAFNLVPSLNVWENIILPIGLDDRKPDMVYLKEIIELLGLSEKLNNLPNTLSGGQQQRVAIARAITVSRLTTFFLIISPPVCSRLPGGLNNSSIGILNCHCQAIFQKT